MYTTINYYQQKAVPVYEVVWTDNLSTLPKQAKDKVLYMVDTTRVWLVIAGRYHKYANHLTNHVIKLSLGWATSMHFFAAAV